MTYVSGTTRGLSVKREDGPQEPTVTFTPEEVAYIRDRLTQGHGLYGPFLDYDDRINISNTVHSKMLAAAKVWLDWLAKVDPYTHAPPIPVEKPHSENQ